MTREENGIRASAFIATSLDGFIARRNGELDWLHSAGAASGDEDHGYGAFMRTVDVIVMGRHTFEKVRSFDKWPYEKPAVVLASRPLVPNELRGAVRHMSGSPPRILAKLFAEGLRQAYVDGGKTIQRFLRAGSIQRLILTRIPVLIGHGIPLFGRVPHDIQLQHIQTRQFQDGIVQSEYIVRGQAGTEP